MFLRQRLPPVPLFKRGDTCDGPVWLGDATHLLLPEAPICQRPGVVAMTVTCALYARIPRRLCSKPGYQCANLTPIAQSGSEKRRGCFCLASLSLTTSSRSLASGWTGGNLGGSVWRGTIGASSSEGIENGEGCIAAQCSCCCWWWSLWWCCFLRFQRSFSALSSTSRILH